MMSPTTRRHHMSDIIDSKMANTTMRRLWKARTARAMRMIRMKRTKRRIRAVVTFEIATDVTAFRMISTTENRTSRVSKAFHFHSGPTRKRIFSAAALTTSSSPKKTQKPISTDSQAGSSGLPCSPDSRRSLAITPIMTTLSTITVEHRIWKPTPFTSCQSHRSCASTHLVAMKSAALLTILRMPMRSTVVGAPFSFWRFSHERSRPSRRRSPEISEEPRVIRGALWRRGLLPPASGSSLRELSESCGSSSWCAPSSNCVGISGGVILVLLWLHRGGGCDS
mmetsp:Transcript_32074/g.92146  ORF Transcript_32074/g.92146 Transcript_32074/m.92146 type:complete len:281 (-) Transcript_32074:624-1466(-)